MKKHILIAVAALITTSSLLANDDGNKGDTAKRDPAKAAAQPTKSGDGAREMALLRGIESWPEVSQKVAKQMVGTYGHPDEVTDTRLIWINNGPWKETIVYREPVKHLFPVPHEDVLEQSVAYRVPTDKFDALARYDGSVVAERTNGVLSARCDKEAMNFLALNLADQLIKSEVDVEKARQLYTETAMKTMKGEQPALVQKLAFDAPKVAAGDPDVPAMKQMGRALGK